VILASLLVHLTRSERVKCTNNEGKPVTDRCTECGFEYRLNEFGEAGPAISAGTARIAGELRRRSDNLGQRPRPDVWSPLEYACHLRDVLLVQRERVLAARRRDRPSFDPMGRDERVDHDGYAGQDPVDVSRQLLDAAAMFANVLARLGPEDWSRTVIYNYPSRTERSLQWVAVHTLHEVRHHQMDIERQLPA
jgi:DinB superfamily